MPMIDTITNKYFCIVEYEDRDMDILGKFGFTFFAKPLSISSIFFMISIPSSCVNIIATISFLAKASFLSYYEGSYVQRK